MESVGLGWEGLHMLGFAVGRCGLLCDYLEAGDAPGGLLSCCCLGGLGCG
jgi:hypothetical protein